MLVQISTLNALNQQGKSVDAEKVELGKVQKCANDAMSQIEEIA